jgi:hypothetical protein
MPFLVYVAGPYRAKTAWDINCNIHKARVWGAALAKCGAYPVIPHSNTANFDGIADDSLWLEGTLALLTRCDAAIFIDGWRESSGSKAEWERANSLLMPVLDVDGWSSRGEAAISGSLRDWLAAPRCSPPCAPGGCDGSCGMPYDVGCAGLASVLRERTEDGEP